MTPPLLTTKLHTPQVTPGLVPRRRLIERLDEGLRSGCRLTLVSAPAGYGKTTLIAEWLRHLRASGDAAPATAWLSLDEEDGDPAHFLAYLIAAAQTIDARLGRSAEAMLHSPQPPPPKPLLTALINDLAAAPCSFVLVLDDYHLIKAVPVHRQLAFLIEHQPDCMHLVVATREDPPLPLPRLRARGQAAEIRQSDLQFTADETADFLRRAARAELSPSDVALLHQRTEGWIAGLQLAALSIRGHGDLKRLMQSFAGSHRYILDYLIEEVLQAQSAETQEFLLQTSILDRFCAPLCQAVTGRADSRERLQALEAANLFVVPLDPAREWYRYHHLFQDLLRHQLRTLATHDAHALHARASRWHEDNGLQAGAVHHALAGADWERAAALVEQLSSALLSRGEIATLIGWLQRLPEELIQARPRLCSAYAWALLLSGQPDAADPLLSRAEQCAQDDPHFLGEVASAQAYLARARGDNPRVIDTSRRALALLPESDLATRAVVALNLGMTYWHAGQVAESEPVLAEAYRDASNSNNAYAAAAAQIFLARNHAVRGALRRAAEQCRAVVEAGGHMPIVALAHLDLSLLHYEWNDLETAGQHLARSAALSRRSGNTEFLISCEMMRARLQLAQGKLAAAVETVQRANDMARDFSPFVRARVAASRVLAALAQNKLDEALRWVEDPSARTDCHTFYMFLGLTQARLLLAQNQKEAAAIELDACAGRAVRAGWGYGLIAARVLQCLAATTREAALDFAADALSRAEPEGFIRSFVEAGAPLAPVLQEAARRGIAPEYVGKILAAIEERPRTATRDVSPLAEPLSAREIEVLRLVAAGLSNSEIAEKLILSPGTIKSHVHNIYGKLEARNRAQAVARARELSLI